MLFSTSQTPKKSLNRSATFNPITPISEFTTGFASPEKDTNNSLKKFNTITTDSYIDSAFEKPQIVRFKNNILWIFNILGNDKKISDKNKNNEEDVKRSNNAMKDHVKNAKINYSPYNSKSND